MTGRVKLKSEATYSATSVFQGRITTATLNWFIAFHVIGIISDMAEGEIDQSGVGEISNNSLAEFNLNRRPSPAHGKITVVELLVKSFII